MRPRGARKHTLGLGLLTVGGLGLLRPAPGTWGSLPPVAIALGLVWFNASPTTINITMIGLCVVFSIVCVVFTPVGELLFARKDASQIVADEVAGQAIALLWLPWRFSGEPDALWWNLMLGAMAFLGFRLFDILKPPPIYQVQRMPRGWGVLMDDLLAGAVALGVLQLLSRVVFHG